MNTFPGGVATLALMLVTMAYASLKMIELTSGQNPTINDSKIDGFFDKEETVNPNEINWRMAFTIENYDARTAIDDSRYVKWIVRVYQIDGDVLKETRLPFHKCTAKDYEQFYVVPEAA